MDASYGWVLENKGKGSFWVRYPEASGFWAGGDVRSMVGIMAAGKGTFLIARNNGTIQGFTIDNK
jgi:hypothetical protein